MSNLISIYSGDITSINKSHRNIGESCGIFIGPLFAGSRKERILYRKQFMDLLSISDDPFVVPVNHIYSHDEYFLLKHLHYIKNYHVMDHTFYTSYLSLNDQIKIIGISGQLSLDMDIYNKKYQAIRLLEIAKKEGFCDILCFNSLNINGSVAFPIELYQMIYQLRPKLIVIGNTKELVTFNFPTTDIKTVLIGHKNHLIYDVVRQSLFRNL